MKASHTWLRELVPALPDDPQIIKQTLTNAGLEVEGVHRFGAASTACILVRVESFKAHPSRSGLRLVTVFDGAATREIVCGAPNVPDAGGLVVLAPLGAELPAVNLTITPRAIGGITSEGMLCSEKKKWNEAFCRFHESFTLFCANKHERCIDVLMICVIVGCLTDRTAHESQMAVDLEKMPEVMSIMQVSDTR
jgi:tRNA-binding EMAP/Myf-like protein